MKLEFGLLIFVLGENGYEYAGLGGAENSVHGEFVAENWYWSSSLISLIIDDEQVVAGECGRSIIWDGSGTGDDDKW